MKGRGDGRGPSFLGIGAQKSGTSWLHSRLSRHPDVWLPPEKELHFFDSRLDGSLPLWRRVAGRDDEAVRWRRQVRRQLKRLRGGHLEAADAGWYWRYFLATPDQSWYRGLFPDDDDLVTGEFTPDYGILDDESVAAVRDICRDDLKLVLVTRNPIERLWSHAKMEERLGRVDVVPSAMEIANRERPRQHTDYLGTIRRWTTHFPADQIWIGFMEDIAFAPEAVLDSLCDFLEVGRPTEYHGARRAVHVGGHAQMPMPVATVLASALEDELAALSSAFGGPAAWWHFTGERLRAHPAGESLDYPLWTSWLWDAWRAHPEAHSLDVLHSGPLVDVLRESV